MRSNGARAATVIGVGVVVTMLALAAAATPRASGYSASCVAAWREVPAAPSVRNAIFYGATALSTNDVWAVGADGSKPLVEHYDGRNWKVATVQPTAKRRSAFVDVAAVTPSDVWAVGESNGLPFAEHWDGKRWRIAGTSRAPTRLNSVSAASANDVWAVGEQAEGFVLHWNGRVWRRSSFGTKDGNLSEIAAISGSDAWGVTNAAVTKHWDGARWHLVHSPAPGATVNELYAVAAAGSKDVWAVGASGEGNTAVGAFAIHWDGRRWSETDPGGFAAELDGLAAVSTSDIWAVGYADRQAGGVVVQHWNGRAWHRSWPPEATFRNVGFVALAAAGHDDVWAVGSGIAHYGCTR